MAERKDYRWYLVGDNLGKMVGIRGKKLATKHAGIINGRVFGRVRRKDLED